MKQSKIALIIIILLVLVNLGTIAFCFWFSPQAHREARRFRSHEGMEKHRKEITQFLDRQLDLSDQQKEAMEALRKDFFTRSGDIRQEIRAARRKFYRLASAANADEDVVEKQADSVAQKQKALEMATFYHFQSLREILNAEQQPRFDTIMQDMLEGRRNNNRKHPLKDRR